MNHTLLEYKIHRNDETIDAGQTPYRGNSIENDALTQHIQFYFSGLPNTYEKIEVEVVKSYDNEDDWIKDVHLMDSFGHLQRVSNYGGELIAKHKLPRQDGK